jgi:serine/arginine repetitive matrix protein 2
MRVASPTPARKGGRVASLDRTRETPQNKPQNQRQPSFTDGNELERAGSRGSINFSYPTGARPISPPPAPPQSQPRHQITHGISQQAANDIQNTVTQVADRPVKKRKKRVASGLTEGRHLASGGMGAKPMGTAVTSSASKSTEPRQIQSRTSEEKDFRRDESNSHTGTQSESLAYGSDSDSASEQSKGKRSQRASGLLNKQPSIVREDWEGEQDSSLPQRKTAQQRQAVGPSPTSSPANVQSKKESALSNTSKKIADAPEHSTREARPTPHLITTLPSTTVEPKAIAPSRDHLEVSRDSARPARQTSISPSRSTRFSTNLSSEFSGKPRHEPPPRSVSPAKSALKHPSPSPQSTSPIDATAVAGWRRVSQASSEASDNASMASADGLGSRSQKKKSARVSFEADAEIVGTAADITPSDTPVFVSPQHKDLGKKGWPGKSLGGHLDSIPAEDDMEEVMKPRPILPSFGSIRGRRDGSLERPLPIIEAASPSSSETSSISNLATLDTSISSDHAIGAVLARELVKNDPEAKTKSSKTTHGATTLQIPLTTDQTLPATVNGTTKSSAVKEHAQPSSALNIPSIAIQPATPGIGESESRDEWLVEVPGGFPEAFELEGDSPATGGVPSRVDDREIATSSPAEIGISEPKPSELVVAEDPATPSVGSFSEALRQRNEPDSDNESGSSSIYSDAAEDLSDLEGDGFGSINAIVESPNIGAPANRLTTPPDSPLAGKPTNNHLGDHPRHGHWDRAEAHWRSVAERQRSADQDETQDHPRRRKKKIRRTSENMAAAQPPKASNVTPDQPRRSLPQPSPSPAINKDKITPEKGAMRRSMRNQPEEMSSLPGFRSSMRTRKAAEPQALALPPSSLPKGALQKKRIPSSTLTSPPGAGADTKHGLGMPRNSVMQMRRTLSNGSDSSSSFKRSRRPVSSGGKVSMRTSMRSGDNRPISPPGPSSRDVRSLSPQNRRPFSPMGWGTMRTSMRGSSDAGVPSLRKQDQQRPSSTIAGFSKSRAKAKTAALKPLTNPKSRFADSDEDVATPPTFRSRFEDSSDDESGVIKYRPVRGIPGKPDQGDSTDLEDSSDEGEKRTAKSRRQGLKSPKLTNGAKAHESRSPDILTPRESPVLPVDGKKKGIFGRFRSKKVKDPTRDDPPAIAEQGKQHGQTRADPEGARSPEIPTSPDAKGKLQRRHISQRTTSDSWPLPPKPVPDDHHERPTTSAGSGSAEVLNGRPGLGVRQDTSTTVRTEGGTPVLGRSGKKKRFPLLRKALGLHD